MVDITIGVTINAIIDILCNLCAKMAFLSICIGSLILFACIVYSQLVFINLFWKWIMKLNRRNVNGLDKITPDKIIKLEREISQYPIILVLYCLEKNGNISSLFRISDTHGINKMIIIGNRFPINPRVTTGSHFRVSHDKYIASMQIHDKGITTNVTDFDAAEKYFDKIMLDNSGKIIFVEQGGEYLENYFPTVTNNEPLYIVIGNEQTGIPKKLMDKYVTKNKSKIISIKQHGTNPSMNVGSAASIVCHHIANYSKFI
jgi:tRNA G18 (ribose-2'-O)-methylase SpoU